MQKTLVCLLLAGFAAVVLALPHSGKTATVEQNGTYYIHVFIPSVYEQALWYCEENYEGSHLAILETKEEEDLVLRGITDLSYWVAGKYDGNGSFEWENGVPFRNNTAWAADQPSMRNNAARVIINYYANIWEARLATTLDSNKLNFICEQPQQ